MARIAFLGFPAHGHTNPTLALISELCRRGHSVDYWSSSPFAQAICGAGATFHDYGPLLTFDPQRLDTNLFRLAATLLETSVTMLPTLQRAVAAKAPGLVIHDSLAPWGPPVAATLSLPSVCSVTTFAMSHRVLLSEPTQLANLLRMAPGALHRLPAAVAARNRLKREWGTVVPDVVSVFSNRAPLNLVYTSRALQPSAHTFGPQFHFVGATIPDERRREQWPPAGEAPRPGDRPLVYISLGTLFNEAPDFYRLCLRALAGAPWDVLLAVGNKVDLSALGPPPANIRMERSVPQIGVLNRAALLITHAGVNSVHEALLAGVPMLLCPQAADQEWVAQRVARLGAGRILRGHRVGEADLRSAVEGALQDPNLRRNARLLGDSLREAGGAPAAADAIESALRARPANGALLAR